MPLPAASPIAPYGLTATAAATLQRFVHTRAHAAINRERQRRGAARARIPLVDAASFERMRDQWHCFCVADEEAGLLLRLAGVAYGDRRLEIRYCNPAKDDKVAAWATQVSDLPDQLREALRVAAIDPGVRTWLMIYVLHPNCQIRIGHGEADRMDMRYAQRRRTLQSQLDLARKRVLAAATPADISHVDAALIKSLPRQMRLVQLELDRARTRLHRLAACVLAVVAPRGILSPNYRVAQMRKVSRRLSAKITRLQGHLGHHAFCMMLESRCHTSNVPIGVFSEAYTTAICSQCGFHNRGVGGGKTFVCPRPGCGHVECRDGGGALKILKKCLHIVNTHYSVAQIQATFPNTDPRPCFENTARYARRFSWLPCWRVSLTVDWCVLSRARYLASGVGIDP